MRSRALAVLGRPSVRNALAGTFSVGIFALALWVLHRTVGRFDLDLVAEAARGYGGGTLVAALLFALGSYAALSGFDLLGLAHIRRPIGGGWAALVSFVSHSISHNAGFAILTGGGVRLRMYSAFGLGVGEVAGVVAFAGLSFALGAAALGAVAFITESAKVAQLLRLPQGLAAGVGWATAAVLVLYLAWTGLARRPLAVGLWKVATPTLGMSLAQMGVAALDLALVAAALYVLLPLETVSYPAFIGLYVVATLAGTLSHVPGGLGVFEGALVLLLPELRPEPLLAALLVFRVFYNLLPLVVGALVLAVFELVHRRRHAAEPTWIAQLGPPLGAVTAFVAGGVLLLTGAVSPPAVLPRWLAEPAHLLSAAMGAALLAAAWGLARQAAWGYRVGLAGLVGGAALALLRGPDWGTAAVMAGGGAVLAAAAPLFRLRGLAGGPSLGWLGAGAAVVAAAAWLTWHDDNSVGLARLLSFASADEGARAMRGNLVAAVALVAAVLAARSRRPATAKPDPQPLRKP